MNWKSIIRNLKNNKLYTGIHLFCIVIGITCSTLLLAYVKNEFQADRFFPNFEKTYQLKSSWGNLLSMLQSRLFKANIPEIESITSYHSSWSNQDLVRYQNNDYSFNKVIYADSLFLDVFQYPILYGNRIDAMQPRTLVLFEKEAKKIFGNSNPVGKNVQLKTTHFGIHNYQVACVLADPPPNTSFSCDLLLPLSDLMEVPWYKKNAEQWGTNNYSVFVRLNPHANIHDINSKAQKALIENSPEWVHDLVPLSLIPLRDIRFKGSSNDDLYTTTNKSVVIALGMVALLVLIIAGVNYFNLTLAMNQEKLGDWITRRNLGATRFQIQLEAMKSTLPVILIGIAISVVAIKMLLPTFNGFIPMQINMATLLNSKNIWFFVLILCLVFLLFATLPSILTTKKIFSNKQNNNNNLRYGLLVFQYSISILLIASSLIIFKQNKLLINHNLGYNNKNVAIMRLSSESIAKSNYLEQEIEKMSSVKGVTFADDIMGAISQNWGRMLYADGKETDVDFTLLNVAPDFLSVFDLELIKGRNYLKADQERQNLIVNDAFVKKYNIEEIIGSSLVASKKDHCIVGVVKNFNYAHLYNGIGPLALKTKPKNFHDVMYIRFNENSVGNEQAIRKIKELWSEVSPNFPFNIEYLSDFHQSFYQREQRLMQLIMMASILAIIMASLGLLGLSFYFINKRIKEIGIRKVNGARLVEILFLLNKHYIVWLSMAFILACPLSHYIMNKWLENFAYKTEISWWIFAISGLTALGIALLTVSLQTFKAARRNPVEALRYE